MCRRAFSIVIILLLAGIPFANGQNDHKGIVQLPTGVKRLFQKQFINPEDVSWTRLDGLIVISFKRGDEYIEAFYSREGKWIRTEMPIEMNTLPPTILQILNNGEFKAWHKGSAFQIESPSKKQKYKVYVYSSDWNEMELIFDARGNRIIDNLN